MLSRNTFLSILAIPLAVSSSASAISQERWVPIWEDEFDGEQIDPGNWVFEVNCWGGGNDERQCYTDRPENAHVENGHLVITARHETWSGSPVPAHWNDERSSEIVEREFTSARLLTRGKVAWTYGRFEIRAQLPSGQGMWPAIWMMPEDNAYGGWAASGEIDIMEAVNFGVPCLECESGAEDRIHGTLHYGGQAPDNTYSGSAISLTDPSAFHIYAIEWTPSYIAWLVDGVEYARQTPDDWHTEGEFEGATQAAPFDQPFHMILNLAIGGNWPEGHTPGPIPTENFPGSMRVDFVRVYTCHTNYNDEGECPVTDTQMED